MKLNLDGASGQLAEWTNINPLKDKLPCQKNAPMIVIHRAFERMSPELVNSFLIELRKSLCDTGYVYLVSLMHDEVNQWRNRGDEYQEHIFGKTWKQDNLWLHNYKNQEEIIDIFADYGFTFVGTFDLLGHIGLPYPCRKLIFKKTNYNRPPYEYLDLKFPKEGKILEIGPGNYPLPIATDYMEWEPRLTDTKYRDIKSLLTGKNIIWGDIQEQNKHIADKAYDFVYCSHVFEHLDYPSLASREISRIGKAGIIIVPSAYKDALTLWNESEHKWNIYPGPMEDELSFVDRNWDDINKIKNNKINSFFTKIYKGDSFETKDERDIKRWFYENEKNMDIVIYWKDSFNCEIL